jgi:tetratricopeptide (TPR) repeat protein
MIPVRTIFRNLTTAWVLALLCGSIASAGPLDDAIRLYDAGRYNEARPLLEKLVANGDADGITYYRLFFCQRAGGDPAQQQTLDRARTLLEKAVESSDGFESAFYLSNTYANLGLSAEVQRLAGDIISRLESKSIDEPTQAVEQFRLGKLYSDQQRDRDAQAWFEKAVDGFHASGDDGYRAYLEWGARWLGNRAMTEERYEDAAKQFSLVGASSDHDDLDKLGRANLMVGHYQASSAAWQRAVVINPNNANTYRYGSALAQLSKSSGEIPISPDGTRGWDELAEEEVSQLLTDNAAVAREILAEAEAEETISPEKRKEFNKRLATARSIFVGAALETVRRGLNLREAAFFGGYAPLIFHPRDWAVASPANGLKRQTLRKPEQKD